MTEQDIRNAGNAHHQCVWLTADAWDSGRYLLVLSALKGKYNLTQEVGQIHKRAPDSVGSKCQIMKGIARVIKLTNIKEALPINDGGGREALWDRRDLKCLKNSKGGQSVERRVTSKRGPR